MFLDTHSTPTPSTPNFKNDRILALSQGALKRSSSMENVLSDLHNSINQSVKDDSEGILDKKKIEPKIVSKLELQEALEELHQACTKTPDLKINNFEPSEFNEYGGKTTNENLIDQHRNHPYREQQNKDYKKALAKMAEEKAESEANQSTHPISPEEMTHLKETALLEVYHRNIENNVQKEYYNPKIIPDEAIRELNIPTAIPQGISTITTASAYIEQEIQYYLIAGFINEEHANILRQIVNRILVLYHSHYQKPGVIPAERAFILARDLLRISIYQQHHEHQVISGSNHGILHIARNIQGSLAMMENVKKDNPKNVTDKDELIVYITHILHDTGYTTGLAEVNFNATKDHPLIGAKFIEDRHKYFRNLLGETGYQTIFRGVLQHAICVKEFVVGKEVDGIHPELIRAVTSISDAVQVAAQDKIQQIWLNNLESLDALCELAQFTRDNPEYAKIPQKLAHPKIVSDPWNGPLDWNNPKDRLAYQKYLSCRNRILSAIENSNISDKLKKHYSNAILNNFNAITGTIVLAQLGLVITDCSAAKKETRHKQKDSGMETVFLPVLGVAPSICAGAIDALTNQLSKQNIKKVLEEFQINPTEIMDFLHQEMQKDPNTRAEKKFTTPTVIVIATPKWDVNHENAKGTFGDVAENKIYEKAHQRLDQLHGNAIPRSEIKDFKDVIDATLQSLQAVLEGKETYEQITAYLEVYLRKIGNANDIPENFKQNYVKMLRALISENFMTLKTIAQKENLKQSIAQKYGLKTDQIGTLIKNIVHANGKDVRAKISSGLEISDISTEIKQRIMKDMNEISSSISTILQTEKDFDSFLLQFSHVIAPTATKNKG